MAPTAQQYLSPSSEYAQVVWVSHILSYLNPFTVSKADHPLQPDRVLGTLSRDGNDGTDEPDDDDPETDAIITGETHHLLAAYDESIRQKFLTCIAELLASKKGGKHVVATALREKEDSVEIDIASNSPFGIKDDEYLASLSRFLGESDTWEATLVDRTIQDAEDSGRSLLEVTVIRNAGRLDKWIEGFANILVGTAAWPAGGARLLNRARRQEYQLSVTDAAAELAEQVKVFSSPAAAGELTKTAARLRVVRLAAVAVLGLEAALIELKRITPSIDWSKASRFCRLIARPAANLRTLARIACLLPNFRAVVFVKVKTPGSTRLSRQQIPSLTEAWSQLGLPRLDCFPKPLSLQERRFREDCARAFPVHCDAQLLLRYEADPSLAPTLRYIGCSKRACFLCHSLLSVLTLHIRVRGQHGVCHPLWGIGPLQSENLQQQLRQLCNMVKEKIVIRLCSKRNRPLPLAVPQSSAVSDVRTADMAVMRRQAVYREEIERRNQEFRERLQILLHPRSIRPPATTAQGGVVCIMCQSVAEYSGMCTGCESVSYCSKQCQSVDWPAHRLLCSSYLVFLRSRPSSLHKLGIWFPQNSKRPKLVWVPMRTERAPEGGLGKLDGHYPELGSFLGPSMDKTISQQQQQQQHHHVPLANKSLRHAVKACRGMTVPGVAGGQLVAMAGGRVNARTSEAADITLGDFRHILDWSSTHGDNTVRETPTGGYIRAVRISCPLEQLLYGRDVFCAVFVQCDLPFASELSRLSDALGTPLQVCKPQPTDLECGTANLLGSAQGGAGRSLHNIYATALMVETDVSSSSWGKSRTIFEGGAVIARSDGADLDPSSVIRVCSYCVNVLQPLFRRALVGEITADDAMREVSPRKLAA